jgi:hypothetical protein
MRPEPPLSRTRRLLLLLVLHRVHENQHDGRSSARVAFQSTTTAGCRPGPAGSMPGQRHRARAHRATDGRAELRFGAASRRAGQAAAQAVSHATGSCCERAAGGLAAPRRPPRARHGWAGRAPTTGILMIPVGQDNSRRRGKKPTGIT